MSLQVYLNAISQETDQREGCMILSRLVAGWDTWEVGVRVQNVTAICAAPTRFLWLFKPDLFVRLFAETVGHPGNVFDRHPWYSN